MTASRLGSVRYDLALGGELQMVLMAMLGGTYIFGGRGTILGTFLAAWLLVIVSTGMIVANVAARGAARRSRHAAHRLDHRHQLHLFPHPEVAGDYPGSSRQQRPTTIHQEELNVLKKTLIAGLALGLAFSATAAFAQDPLSIVYIGKNTGNPYFDSITGGFEDACASLGCEFEFVAPATAEATSQIPFIEAQIQRGVDVIAIAPNSPDALNQVLDSAKAAGILVLTVNGDLTGNEEHRDATILPVNFDIVGRDQVEMVGSLIGYEGEIAILSATTEAPDQNKWIVGMNETLANDPKYAKMKLVATVYGDDQPEKSTTEMEALLSNFPNLKGVIAPTTVGIAAAAQVVQSRGIADDGRTSPASACRAKCATSSRTAPSPPSSSGRRTMKAGSPPTSPRASRTARSRTKSAPPSKSRTSAPSPSTKATRSTPRPS